MQDWLHSAEVTLTAVFNTSCHLHLPNETHLFFIIFLKRLEAIRTLETVAAAQALTSLSPQMLTLESCSSAGSLLRNADCLYGHRTPGIRLVPVGEQTGVC